MVFDAARGKVLLFGGTTGGGETWTYDAAGWTQLTPASSPPARERHAMVYDSARNVAVLFGGRQPGSTTNLFNDTWEWDGTNWSPRPTTTQPTPRIDMAMAYDAARSRTVLYAGLTSGTAPNDTWEWNGTTWNRVVGANNIGRTREVAFFDPVRGKCQVSIDGLFYMEMWEFDGAVWSPVVDHTGGLFHGDRQGPCGAYDPVRQHLLTFGGAVSTTGIPYSDETEEWDSYLWFLRLPTPRPLIRAWSAMAYDSQRRVAVLFGGLGVGSISLGDTWEWSSPYPRALVAQFGANCPASSVGVDPVLQQTARLPVIGTTFRTSSSGGNAALSILLWGFSRTFIGGVIPLPFDLTLFGLNGCNLLVDMNFNFFQGSRNANWDFPVPNDPNLIGLTAYLQAVVAAAGANPANLATSNGLQFTIGG